MCGIGLVKFYNNTPSGETLKKCINIINTQQSRRGPDNNDFWISDDRRTMICHQRLSILDTNETSNQPFENYDYIGSFNGEIYNYLELNRNKVSDIKSDTLFLKHNLSSKNLLKLLPTFDGPFSLLLYEKKSKNIILARDRFGEKPIYYFKNNNHLIVASTIQAIILILHELKIGITKNKNNILNVIQYGYSNSIDTPIDNVYSLPKATIAIDDSSQEILIPKSYLVQKQIQNNTICLDNISFEFKDIFEESVIQRLRSDVPIGIFLSGGLDSSLIAAFASKVYQNQVLHYTIDFDDRKKEHFKRAEIISNALGNNGHQILLTKDKLFRNLKIIGSSLTTLFIDPAQLLLLVLSEHASKHTPVCLAGDGADELFYGYRRYSRFNKLKQLKFPIFRTLFSLITSIKPFIRFSRYNKVLSAKSLINSYLNMFYFWYGIDPIVNNKGLSEFLLSFFDIIETDPCKIDQKLYLPEVILRKSDSCSMFHSVETRLPYLSTKILEYSNKVRNINYKLTKKEIFLPLLRFYLGDQVFHKLSSQPKIGLTSPLKQLFSDKDIQIYLDKYFNYDRLSQFDFLDTRLILFNWDRIKYQNVYNNLYGMWAIFTLLQWFEDYHEKINGVRK